MLDQSTIENLKSQIDADYAAKLAALATLSEIVSAGVGQAESPPRRNRQTGRMKLITAFVRSRGDAEFDVRSIAEAAGLKTPGVSSYVTQLIRRGELHVVRHEPTGYHFPRAIYKAGPALKPAPASDEVSNV